MTPEECARFILSDCQDPVLKAKAAKECDEQLAEAMKNPIFKANWDANIRDIADQIDREVAKKIYG